MSDKKHEDFIARAGFSYGWLNLESWARRMAEQAVDELDEKDAQIEKLMAALKMAGTALPQDGNLVCDNGWTLNAVVKIGLCVKGE
jgi:hypothetical protein